MSVTPEPFDPQRDADIHTCLGALSKAARAEALMHFAAFLHMQRGGYKSPEDAALGFARRLGHFGYSLVKL